MKFIIIILAVFGSTENIVGQDTTLFQKYKFDSSCKLLAVCSYNEENIICNKDFSFYIENLSDIISFRQQIKLGKPLERAISDENTLDIYIVKDKEIQDEEIYVNIENSNIIINGQKYYFDVSQLRKMHNSFPINYSFKWETLKSEKKFKNKTKSYTTNKNILAYQDNTFEFGGICEIFINRNSKCTSGRQGIQIIEQKLLNLGYKETDFLIGYVPTSDEDKTFKLTFQATKDKYDKLIGSNFKKGKWKSNDYEILSYWRK